MSDRISAPLVTIHDPHKYFSGIHENNLSISRLAVPGGWIVITTVIAPGGGAFGASTFSVFVSDPAHEWPMTKTDAEGP